MKFTRKESTWIIITIIILTFIIGFSTDTQKQQATLTLLTPLIISIIIILTTVITKKLVAPLFSIEIEHSIWDLQRYGIYKRSYWKKPFPLGLIIPFAISFLTLGLIKPMTLLQFNYKNIPHKRILKQRRDRRHTRKEEINDSDYAFVAAWGFYILLLIAIISSIFNSISGLELFSQLTKYSIFYGLWNLIPIGKLDGSKLFFGSILSWTFITVLYLLTLFLILIF